MQDETPTITRVREPISEFEKEMVLFRVVHIQHPGPKGGRPRERPMMIDNAGVHTLLDTLPPADRLRFEDGRELACRGTRAGDTVDALVPLVTPEAVHMEFMRRHNLAIMEDMEKARRSSVDTFTATQRNQADQLKSMGAMFDTMQAFTERMTGAMEKMADRLEARERSEEAGLVEMLLKESGGIQGLLGMIKMLKAGPA